MKQYIYLVGLPGSGKSYIAKQCANKFGIESVDLDHFIVHHTGMTIANIFTTRGELGFRNIETAHLHQIRNIYNEFLTVISTGGGCPCFNNNIDYMLNTSTVVFIDTPIWKCVWRIFKNRNSRPMFKGDGILDIYFKLKKLAKERRKYYTKANLIITPNGVQTAEHILWALGIIKSNKFTL